MYHGRSPLIPARKPGPVVQGHNLFLSGEWSRPPKSLRSFQADACSTYLGVNPLIPQGHPGPFRQRHSLHILGEIPSLPWDPQEEGRAGDPQPETSPSYLGGEIPPPHWDPQEEEKDEGPSPKIRMCVSWAKSPHPPTCNLILPRRGTFRVSWAKSPYTRTETGSCRAGPQSVSLR